MKKSRPKCFERSGIRQIVEFIMSDGEIELYNPDTRSLEARQNDLIREREKGFERLFEAVKEKEYLSYETNIDLIYDCVMETVSELYAIYFQMGMKAGVSLIKNFELE